MEIHEEKAKETVALKKRDASQHKGKFKSILKPETDLDAKVDEDPDVEREREVHFEDETFKQEKKKAKITFDMFIRILEHLFESDETLLVVDSNNELDSYF